MQQLKLWGQSSVAVAEPQTAPASPVVDPPPLGRRTTAALTQWFARQLARPVRLVLTNNRSTMMSSRQEGRLLKLRLHQIFFEAPPEVLHALTAYLGWDDRDAGRIIDHYVRARASDVASVPVETQPAGRFFNLEEIFSDLNRRFFHDTCTARITWGTAASRRYRRSIQLGVYVADDNLIRIHPSLDQAFVPRHYVAWVVFHEMLHELFGVGKDGQQRRSLHPPDFQVIEETYPDYARCKRWEEQNLHRLLQYRPPRKRP